MIKVRSKIIFSIKNKTFFKQLILRFRRHKLLKLEGERKTKFLAKYFFNYNFDFDNPKSFNEYLVWIKYNYRNELWEQCADKLGSKTFLKSIGLDKYVVKTLGEYDNVSEIDLEALPKKFVIKTNHDCGTVFICVKGETDFDSIYKKLSKSIKNNYCSANDEWVYKNIKPKIFVEEYVESFDGGELVDYKFQTIGGKFIFGYALFNKKQDERYLLFEDNFNIQKCMYQSLPPKNVSLIKKPKQFEEMKQIAEMIGRYFVEVRVDFYISNHGLKIGELTFFTQSGFGRFTDKKYDLKYGRFFDDALTK